MARPTDRERDGALPLPEAFVARMREQLGAEEAAFFAAYSHPPVKAIRVNTLKVSTELFQGFSPFALTPVPWEPNGFYVTCEKAGKSLYHAAGVYYVQEPSAMCAAPLLDVKSGECVLDLCSAPGGKGTQLAQAMEGGGVIVLNEINRSRAEILSQNVERLGVVNAVVTCLSPQALVRDYCGCFDKILVDAPCSGEGMFKKEPNAIPEWSVDNVRMCAARQREILDCAAKLLRAGGKLAYSTCTFSREEDEEQIERFLSEHAEFTLEKSEKLYPHRVKGEGHYAALLVKDGAEDGGRSRLPFSPVRCRDEKLVKIYRQFERETLGRHFSDLHLAGGNLYSMPFGVPPSYLRAGVHLGEFKGDVFRPSHSLAMALSEGQARSVEVDEDTAYAYLEGNVFPCDPSLRGWLVVRYRGFALGWCKAVDGTAKNHLPKGLRQRLS